MSNFNNNVFIENILNSNFRIFYMLLKLDGISIYRKYNKHMGEFKFYKFVTKISI